MADVVPYHHPADENYSLAYVTTDRADIETSGADARIEQYECDESFYVLYTDHGTSGDVDDIPDGFDDALDEMDPADRLITLRLLQIFEGVVEAQELEEGERLEIYKQIQLEEIPDAIAHVDWTQTAAEVAGDLMSALILKHALPNANHRTAISMAEWYLESVDSGFSLPELATTDYEWRKWVNEYVQESKRLLTVRRNTTAFSMLESWGCETVVRKGDIEIDLSDYDLDYQRSTALEAYADRHRQLCQEFMIESVTRAGHDELLRTPGPSKSAFVSYLQQAE